ncbi:MAG: menaquinone biosynthesis protein [Phycisphaerae bacterium]
MTDVAVQAGAGSGGVWRLGAVAYLNARPLTAGLAAEPGVQVRYAVPAALGGLLESGAVDAAQVPVVDLWRASGRWEIVSDGCIASQAETLTVRVFSRVSPDRLTRLHGDPESHTSVALARVLWQELYGTRLEIVTDAGPGECEAELRIGDKVVAAAPRGFGFEVDLGGAWRHLTGLPFVFAVWAARAGRDWSALAALLERARDAGVSQAAALAERHAREHGWPVELARRYLCETLCYQLTPAMRDGLARFFELGQRHGVLGRDAADAESGHAGGRSRLDRARH